MATDLDTLMNLDPLSLSDRDLDAIIAVHRNNRAREGGTKQKAKSTFDVGALVRAIAQKSTEAAPEPPKPAGGGLRRI